MTPIDVLDVLRVVGPAVLAGVAVIYKVANDFFEARRARERLLEAEKEAFKVAPEAFLQKTEELRASQESLEEQARQLSSLIQNSQAALQVGNLFDLYSKQIDKYQTETQARAGWSFIFAIFAMLAGLGFVVWGGAHILTSPGWEHVAAGTAISAIGGATGAFITKTFLDVHRLSLSQLNHYFRQPVLNAHVLTAQRLADQLEDKSARQRAYEKILTNVAGLIREDNLPGEVWVPKQVADVAPRKRTQKVAAAANSKSNSERGSSEQA